MFYEIDEVPRTPLGKPQRFTVSSKPNKPLTARSKLQTRDSIEALVLAETAGACGLDTGDSGSSSSSDWIRECFDQPFLHLGLSSMVGVVLRDRLASLTGLSTLPNTLVFDHPTPAAVSEYLCEKLLRRRQTATVLQPAPTQVQSSQNEPIAIISMACRFPGGVTSPEELWQLVYDEIDATSEFPNDVSLSTLFLY